MDQGVVWLTVMLISCVHKEIDWLERRANWPSRVVDKLEYSLICCLFALFP